MRIDVLKLRTTMLKNDLKQRDLSRRTGISYSMINAVCNGRKCSDETIRKIASVLEMEPEELKEN